jgi:hypothetical protein
MITDAMIYGIQGMSVIPIQPRDKKPLVVWEPFQNYRADPDMVKFWYKKWPLANVGIVTGKISGIVVVDCDSREGLDEVNQYIRASLIGKIPTVSTGKGFHLYFKHPETVFVNNRAGLFDHVDVRGDGGYVLAPPSIHPSGKTYAWASVAKLADAPDIPPELLNLILASPAKKKEASVPPRRKIEVVWETNAKSSDPTHEDYRVRLMGSGNWTCNCARFVKGHKECRHIDEKRTLYLSMKKKERKV